MSDTDDDIAAMFAEQKAKEQAAIMQGLRDKFAMAALTGIMSGLMTPTPDQGWHGWSFKDIAKEAFSVADACMEARTND